MFPIIDVRGNVIGFGGRIMSNDKNTAKYLNSPETLIFNKRKNLFGLNLAKKTKLEYLILVEGYMDAIALHQYGFDCAVASLGTSLTEEHAVLLSRYTENVVLIYDGDEAGQRAAQRAIPMLEKAGLHVKVLTLRDAKDPDEYLKKFGADKFRNLLNESSNRVEYQINAIRKKYDLTSDEDRVKFTQEAAELICTLPGVAKREVYGNRVAELAKISPEAMKMEVERARKRTFAREKRKQEQIDLTPASQLQRRNANRIPYDNVKSARAEEYIIAAILLEPAMLDHCSGLTAEQFSVPLFGKVYRQIREQHAQGVQTGVSSLADLSSDEMSHIVGIYQNQPRVNEQAFRDCVGTVLSEHRVSTVDSADDLMALRNKMKERKGINA
jgi:DNA primase